MSENTGTGRAENGNFDRIDGEVRGSGREAESSRSDELGGKDEQHQTFSRGDDIDGADLQLSHGQENTENRMPDSGENSLSGSFFEAEISEEQRAEVWKGILCNDDFLKHKRPEIAGYFEMEPNTILQADYMRNCFSEKTYCALDVAGRSVGFHAGEDGF